MSTPTLSRRTTNASRLRRATRRDAGPLLAAILERLVADSPLPPSNRDHALTCDWLGYRECHVKPDLLLVYKKPDDLTLRLARFGSHSELFG